MKETHQTEKEVEFKSNSYFYPVVCPSNKHENSFSSNVNTTNSNNNALTKRIFCFLFSIISKASCFV